MQSKLSKFALVAVAGAMVSAGIAGTATAAGTAYGKDYKGRVTANGGLYVRARPTTDSKIVGWHAKGSVVSIKCKVNGENVGGNRRWYQLNDGTWGYSSARYIDNIGPAPKWCDSTSGNRGNNSDAGRDNGNGNRGNHDSNTGRDNGDSNAGHGHSSSDNGRNSADANRGNSDNGMSHGTADAHRTARG